MTESDITIVGAGPVGQACALFLARHWPDPARIVLIDAKPANAAVHDPRVLALAHGSRQLLERIHAWPHMVTPIQTIHVSQRGQIGHTRIQHTEHHVPALGYVTAYGHVQQTLQTRIAQSGVTVKRPCQLLSAHEQADHVLLETDQATWHTRYLIHAEGMPAATTAAAAVVQHDYQQHALLGFVQARHAQPHTAFERFTPHGPLALLPHVQDGCQGYAVVWCVAAQQATTQAAMLQQLDSAERTQQLQQLFGQRLGQLTATGTWHAVPLLRRATTTVATPRTVRIGNAAQTLHPVAGQGLNLGLRDAWVLNTVLQHAVDKTIDCAEVYQPSRSRDRHTVLGLTDYLARRYTAQEQWPAKNILLGGLNLMPWPRHMLARVFMYGNRHG